jgi:thioredoxin 1
MNNEIKEIFVVVLLLAAIGTIVGVKHFKSKTTAIPFQVKTGMPLLLELGSVSCIPCKAMKVVLDELRTEYNDSMKIAFIDVWEDEKAGEQFNYKLIPTQIFFDPNGNELFKHEGFFAKEAILAKWKELGVDLTEAK